MKRMTLTYGIRKSYQVVVAYGVILLRLRLLAQSVLYALPSKSVEVMLCNTSTSLGFGVAWTD
jgi:hypothetical protein